MPISELARAKVNLTLKVLGRRIDGFHEIESLVTFAEVGDVVRYRSDRPREITIEGSFAGQIAGPNILRTAIDMLHKRNPYLALGAFELEKNLPVAAGLGGGSADAGALLRLVRRTNRDVRDEMLQDVARSLGADVPVCFTNSPVFMSGIGDHQRQISGTPGWPQMPAVLVNPGVPLATARVFEALGAAPYSAPGRTAIFTPSANVDELLNYIRLQGNDLERPAVELVPVIADVKTALEEQDGCRLAAMSGSGPTCFGIFASAAQAASAARTLRGAHLHWWVRDTAMDGVVEASAE